MVDFNGIETFLFDLKIHQNRWQLELRPRPYYRAARGVLNTAGDDGNEGTMNLPQYLGYAIAVNLNRTKSFLFDLKCTRIAGGWGSAPDPAGGAYSALQNPSCWKGGKGREGEGKGGEGKGREGRGRTLRCCPNLNFLATPLFITITTFE